MRITQAEYESLVARRSGARVARLVSGRRWEDEFARQLDEAQVSYLREMRFEPGRQFRFDFAILPKLVIAVEIDGAVHRIKSRFNGDREKGNLAVLRGWRVLHFSPAQVRSGEALSLLRLALAGAKEMMQTSALDVKEIEA